jgi:hypothetical protein
VKVRTANVEEVDVVDLDEVDEEEVPFSPANPMAPPKNIGIAIAGMKSLVRIEVYSVKPALDRSARIPAASNCHAP